MLNLHLYRVSEGENVLYIFSTHTIDKERQIRNFHVYNDHGDMDYEDYMNTATKGKLEEITDLSQVNKDHYHWVPYCTEEWVEETKDYLEVDESIYSFFSDKKLKNLYEEKLKEAPTQHSKRTPQCPAPGTNLLAMKDNMHVRNCGFCQKIIKFVEDSKKPTKKKK